MFEIMPSAQFQPGTVAPEIAILKTTAVTCECFGPGAALIRIDFGRLGWGKKITIKREKVRKRWFEVLDVLFDDWMYFVAGGFFYINFIYYINYIYSRGINKLQFFYPKNGSFFNCKFFTSVVIKPLDPELDICWIRIRIESTADHNSGYMTIKTLHQEFNILLF